MQSTQRTQSLGDYAFWTLGFLFVLGMHYFQHHPGGDGLQNSFNTFSWIPVSVFIGLVLLHTAQVGVIVYTRLTLQLLLCAGLLLIPALYPHSQDAMIVGRLYGLIAGLLVFVALQQLRMEQRQLGWLLLFVLIAVWIQGLLGWAQHLKFIPEGWFGYTEENPIAFGVFRQPNVMAVFMATGLIFSAFLIPLRKFADGKWHNLATLFCVLTPLITVPIIMLLNSRAGWIGAVVGVLLIGPYLYKSAERKQAIVWYALCLLGIGIGVLLLAINDPQFSQTLNKAQLDPIRLKMYPAVIQLIQTYLVSGVGYGNFEAGFNEFAAGLYAAGLAEPSGVTNLHHPHNELLFWAAEGGIVALAGLLLAAFFVFRTILRAETGLRLALVALFFPIVLHTQTEYPFYHAVVMWIIFIIIIFVADFHGNAVQEKPLKPTLLVATAGYAIPVTTTAFMLTTLHASAVLDRYQNSPGASPEMLYSIVNPMVWRERILFTLRGNAMLAGLSRNDPSAVQPFIDLTEENIKRKPRWQRFQDLIFAYEFLGDHENATAIKMEAEYRFPTVEFGNLSTGDFVIRSMIERNRVDEG